MTGFAQQRDVSMQRARRLVAAGNEANLALAADDGLRSLERRPPDVLDTMQLARLNRQVEQQLVAAGDGLLRELRTLSRDDELWASLSGSLEELARNPPPLEAELRLREAVSHDVTAVLESLGYPPPPPPPPPPVDYWAGWMQEPLERLLSRPGGETPSESRVAEARSRLLWFLQRLDRVLETARDRIADEAARPPDPRGRRVLRAAVAAGRDKAIPVAAGAGLAGGVGALIGADPLVGVLGVLGAAGVEAVKETVKTLGEAAVAEGLAGQEDPAATRQERLEASIRVLYGALHEEPDPQWTFIARRNLFAVLQDWPDTPHPDRTRDRLLQAANLIELGHHDEVQDAVWAAGVRLDIPLGD